MRHEFTAKTKRAALERSGGRCEADGALYGLPVGTRCANDLARGVIFDHVIADHNSRDNSLENCKSICFPCNRFKTHKHDAQMIAKTRHQFDKHHGIKDNSRPMPGSRASNWKKRMDGTVVRR